MIVKTALAVFTALVLALAITYSVHDWFSENYGIKSNFELFYSQDFDPDKKKIYLIGSSQVHRLNATHIEEFISQTYDDYEVYNLTVPNDQAEFRFLRLQDMIDSNPVMAVYGITFRDLIDIGLIEIKGTDLAVLPDIIPTEKPENIIPERDKIIAEWLQYEEILEFFNFDDSQENTIGIMKFLVEESIQPVPIMIKQERTPFYLYKPFMYEIWDEEILKRQVKFETKAGTILTSYGSEPVEAYDLKRIISTLQDNNIKVVLFSVPYPRALLDELDKSSFEIFTSVLDDISDEYDVPVYHFYDKYADMNIWNDYIHVTLHEDAAIYTSDLKKIILSEIPP